VSIEVPASGTLVAIVPTNDLDRSEAFYRRLGFGRREGEGDFGSYRILSDGAGGHLHLRQAEQGWVEAARNPFGVYLYSEHVDHLARELADEIIEPEGPSAKPWGMYEFAVSDPDGTLVRIGWPSGLRAG
jgi:catechol 2,3-dioxygenase-like lactoylglutathione lyase family enzyme